MDEDDANNRVLLNVGGAYFETCRSTLMSTGSDYFARRLVDYELPNYMFIDRDPQYFVYVLSYMRNRQISFPSDTDKMFVDQMRLEATFFNLSDLNRTMLKIMHEKRGEDTVVAELRLLRSMLAQQQPPHSHRYNKHSTSRTPKDIE